MPGNPVNARNNPPMDCENCGSPLQRVGETCTFCGARHTAEPAAQVPLAHQRGEGRELNKTFDDSLRSIQEGIAFSERMYQRDVRRSKWGLIAIKVICSLPLIGGLSYFACSRPEKVDYQSSMAQGVASVKKGDYLNAKLELGQAARAAHEKAEPHVYYGAAFYSELLERPVQDPARRKDMLYAFYREMNFALQADKDHPQANFVMGLCVICWWPSLTVAAPTPTDWRGCAGRLRARSGLSPTSSARSAGRPCCAPLSEPAAAWSETAARTTEPGSTAASWGAC